MRILHIGKYYPPIPGGMERFLGDLVNAQRLAGDDVTVLVHGDQQEGDPPWLLRCPVWLKLIFAPISPLFPFWLARTIRLQQPDVLHIHMPNVSAFWALLVPSARRIPWVIHWHSDVVPSSHKLALRLAYPHYRIFERALLEHAEAIVATSMPYLKASAPLQPWRHKCHVVPLGVDPARLPDVALGSGDELWQGHGLRLLAIGRLSYYKGFETLIQAVAAAESMELLLVGEGEERPRLERMLTKLGNPARIRLLGQQDDATCQRLLASCDVFCLPSRERTEAFGIVLMEAMRYGKAIVASDLHGSGVIWVVRDGENGFLAPPEDASAWQSALSTLASDPVLKQRLGENGRRRFEQEFQIARVEEILAWLYTQVLDGGEAFASRLQGKEALPLIVIPALNEADAIGPVLRQLRDLGYRDVVVIDDGSTDDTARIAADCGAVVLHAPLSQGAWGAMQTGIRYALRQGYAGVVTMDADGQHEPEHVARLLAAGQVADVVIGACTERGSLMHRIAWAYFRMLTGFGLEDLTSGFRYYNGRACQVLAQQEATLLDYQDIGVLLLLSRAGMQIQEVSVNMVPRKNGPSRIFSSWWVVARYMAETTLLCLARWKTKPVRL
jgi:glycosyltransferase involved in cell wall biosynthesis